MALIVFAVNGVVPRASKRLMLAQKVTTPASMFPPTSANSVALRRPLVSGQRSQRCSALICLQFGLVVLHSLISPPPACRGNSAWLIFPVMARLSPLVTISMHWLRNIVKSTPQTAPTKTRPEIQITQGALHRIPLSLHLLPFHPLLTNKLVNVWRKHSAANLPQHQVTTQTL